MPLNFTVEEKKELLRFARHSIQSRLEKSEAPLLKIKSNIFDQKLGVFVSLHLDSALRGCIGYVVGYKPLAVAVAEMARSAAFNDPRFEAVNLDELAFVDIEISVLSPLRDIKSIDEIEVGKHGLVIEKKGSRGLLLPQVATEWGWNREQFLEQTCIKAGLDLKAWQDKESKIQIFSAEIFSEKELNR